MPERNQFRIALNSLLVICAVNCVLSLPAGEKPWTLDALMQLRTVSDPQITADGTQVAYVVREVDAGRNRYKSEIWVTAASGGVARRAAKPHFSDARPRWSPDGRNL